MLRALAGVLSAPSWYETLVSLVEPLLKLIQMVLVTQDLRSPALARATDPLRYAVFIASRDNSSWTLEDNTGTTGVGVSEWGGWGKLKYIFLYGLKTPLSVLIAVWLTALAVPTLLALLDTLSRKSKLLGWLLFPVVILTDLLCIMFYNTLISSGMAIISDISFVHSLGLPVISAEIKGQEIAFLILLGLAEVLLVAQYFILTVIRTNRILRKPLSKISRRPFSGTSHKVPLMINIYVLTATIISDFNAILPVRAPILFIFSLYIYISVVIDDSYYSRAGNVFACFGFALVLATASYNIIMWIFQSIEIIKDIENADMSKVYKSIELLGRMNELWTFVLTVVGLTSIIIVITLIFKRGFMDRIVVEIRAHAQKLSSCVGNTVNLKGKPRLYVADRTLGVYGVPFVLNMDHTLDIESVLEAATTRLRLLLGNQGKLLSRWSRFKEIVELTCYVLELEHEYERNGKRFLNVAAFE